MKAKTYKIINFYIEIICIVSVVLSILSAVTFFRKSFMILFVFSILIGICNLLAFIITLNLESLLGGWNDDDNIIFNNSDMLLKIFVLMANTISITIYVYGYYK